MTTLQRLRDLGVSPQQKSIPINQANLLIGTGTPVYGPVDSQANVDAYVTSDDLYSIVRRIARTAAMVKRTVYIVKDDKALKELQLFKSTQTKFGTKELMREAVLRLKALEAVPEDNPLQKLIDNPNPEYAASVFYEGCYTYRLLTGNTYIHTPILEFGANAGRPIEMWIMPSQFTSLNVTDTWPRRISSFRLMVTSLITVSKDEVIHLKYFNPKFNYTGNELLGLSPVTAASRLVTRGEAETDYSVNAFQNAGISGIVANKSIQNDEVEKGALGQLKSDFYSEASGSQNARKLLFQVGDISYIPIGLSPVDMNVIESQKWTFKKKCNVFGVSDRLFNNDATGSEISVDIAYKDLYTNAVLPECYALDSAFNLSLVPKFSKDGKRYFIMSDISEITELQDDMKDMAAIFGQLPVMIPNVIAKAYGWGDIDNPDMDEVYIKTGYSKLEDLNAVPDIPLTNELGN